MREGWLDEHLILCRRNLRRKNIRRCLRCPFEPEICEARPKMREYFDTARLRRKGVLGE